jgi:hypothetical protein
MEYNDGRFRNDMIIHVMTNKVKKSIMSVRCVEENLTMIGK